MKIGHIILIIVAIIAVIAGVVIFTNSNNEEVNVGVENEVQTGTVEDTNFNENTEPINVQSVQDLTALVDKVYEGLELFPSLATMELDLTDMDMVTYETGLTSVEDVDGIVVSAPMMSSQAYSMILVKAKDASKADLIAKEMNDNVNPNKWICVSAEKVYATSCGNVAFLVMTNADMADDVYESFKKYAGNVGTEYSRENAMDEMPVQEDMMIPAL